MEQSRFVWLVYGVVFSAAAVWLAESAWSGSALTWVLYAGAAAILGALIRMRFPRG